MKGAGKHEERKAGFWGGWRGKGEGVSVGVNQRCLAETVEFRRTILFFLEQVTVTAYSRYGCRQVKFITHDGWMRTT